MGNSFSAEDKMIVIIFTVAFLLLVMGIALLFFFFLSRRKIIEKELEKKSLEINHQKEMIQSIIITQEKERKRIAQDLHDDISSKLNVINLNANLLKDGELSTEEYITVNNSILDATDKTLESARKIAHNLLPPILDKFGLKAALEELVDSFNNSKKINIQYDLEYPKKYLKPNNELHVFRIVQELINNSLRHGKAQNTNLNIDVEQNIFSLNYFDDGIGFNLEEIKHKKGIGMKNIESRVALLQGNLSVKSAINQGFSIKITI